MKITGFLFKARGAFLALLGGVVLLSSLDANAIPVFARQTGFKCVACHVGGEYPQLTALGRYFKLTGYTQGDAKNIFGEMTTNWDRSPFAIMFQASKQWYANTEPGGINGSAPTSAFDGQVVSIFTGGHFTDNLGAFIQFTSTKYDGTTTSGSQGWATGIDNSEIRLADHIVNKSGDWIYGAYLNNRITMSDVWNTQENWTADWIGYFNGGSAVAPSTFLQSGLSQHTNAGLGTYLYKDKTWYGELAIYRSVTSGPVSVITEGTPSNSAPPLNNSLYARFGYNKEWGPHELFVGLHGLYGSGDIYGTFGGAGGTPATPVFTTANPQSTFQDTGVDAQYQYILDPHYFAAHARFTHENLENAGQLVSVSAQNPTSTLNEYWVDFTYVYQAKYGAMLFFHGARGSSDNILFTSNINNGSNSPDWDSIMPSIFWAPYQNVRIGLMETFYTRLAGTTGNAIYNPSGGAPLSPHDFNTTMLYLGLIY